MIDTTFIQSSEYQDYLNHIEQISEESIVFVEEEGKERLIEHGKEFNFVPSGGKEGQSLYTTENGVEWTSRWKVLEKVITEAKKWDFTSWSSDTVNNLNIDTESWSDDEKGNGVTVEGCYWQVTAGASTLKANDVIISELEGLKFTNTNNRGLAIATNYPTTSVGTYHGPQYLWLGSKEINYFVIPNVVSGTTIKIGVESHKPAESRGLQLYIGEGNSGQQLKGINGEDIILPTTYEEQIWKVPEGDSASYNITVRNTNGCHIYFIETTVIKN